LEKIKNIFMDKYKVPASTRSDIIDDLNFNKKFLEFLSNSSQSTQVKPREKGQQETQQISVVPTVTGHKGGKPKRKVGMSKKKSVRKGGAAVDGLDTNAVYNVSGLITTNRDVLGTALNGTESLLSVHTPFGAGSTNNVNTMSTEMNNLITPTLGKAGGAAPKKKAKAKAKKTSDLKGSQKEKSKKKK
jgi:hypothetical protein